MSLTIPYNTITQIISSANPASITLSDRLLFVDSLKNTYLVLGIINAIAIAPSLLQISRKTKNKQEKILITSPEG
jgi:hypothetical protein